VTADDSEMMLAGVFRLGGVVARIRGCDDGTCGWYDVMFTFSDDETTAAVVHESQLDDLADAAKAASHMILRLHDQCSLVKLAETLRGYAVERLDDDPTPSTKENTP